MFCSILLCYFRGNTTRTIILSFHTGICQRHLVVLFITSLDWCLTALPLYMYYELDMYIICPWRPVGGLWDDGELAISPCHFFIHFDEDCYLPVQILPLFFSESLWQNHNSSASSFSSSVKEKPGRQIYTFSPPGVLFFRGSILVIRL